MGWDRLGMRREGELLLAEILKVVTLAGTSPIWCFYASEYGEEVFLEDMEKYAFRAILSC